MIGRQPILDRRRRALGYELVFNLHGGATTAVVAPGTAAAHVVADGILSFGLDRLVGPRRAFIEIPPAWLSHEVIAALPTQRVVIAIPSDSPIDAEAAQACLDARKNLSKQPAAIATGVETAEAFNEALKQGSSHAQGYFFARDTDIESTRAASTRVGNETLESAMSLRVDHFTARKTGFHRSPTVASRSGIVRSVNVCGPTSPCSISCHVQGADTGAPDLGRTL